MHRSSLEQMFLNEIESNFVFYVFRDEFKNERPTDDVVYYRPPKVKHWPPILRLCSLFFFVQGARGARILLHGLDCRRRITENLVKRQMYRSGSRNNIPKCRRVNWRRFTFSHTVSPRWRSSIGRHLRTGGCQTVDEREKFVAFLRERRSSTEIFLWSLVAGINCLHADGAQFIHPLQHLGKSLSDLPVVAIDSFRHMFLFPDFNEIS